MGPINWSRIFTLKSVTNYLSQRRLPRSFKRFYDIWKLHWIYSTSNNIFKNHILSFIAYIVFNFPIFHPHIGQFSAFPHGTLSYQLSKVYFLENGFPIFKDYIHLAIYFYCVKNIQGFYLLRFLFFLCSFLDSLTVTTKNSIDFLFNY